MSAGVVPAMAGGRAGVRGGFWQLRVEDSWGIILFINGAPSLSPNVDYSFPLPMCGSLTHLSLIGSPSFPDVEAFSHLPSMVYTLPNYWVALFPDVGGPFSSPKWDTSLLSSDVCAPLPPSDPVCSLSSSKASPPSWDARP